MKRYEVRGDHRAWGTTETSGRIAADEVIAEAQRMLGHAANLVIVDHETGLEAPYTPDWTPQRHEPW